MSAYNKDEWDGLMRDTLKGDAKAYHALLLAIRPWLYSYFNRRLMGSDCDDLVQLTLLSIHQKRETFDPTQPLMPWLCAVARHKLIDHVRKYKRHVHIELDDNLADEGMGPSLAARDVEVLLQQLPFDQAQVLRLHKLKQMSVDEVSKTTGFSVSNVKVLVHRGLKKLQAIVGGGARNV